MLKKVVKNLARKSNIIALIALLMVVGVIASACGDASSTDTSTSGSSATSTTATNTGPQNASSGCPSTIRYGSRGDRVKQLQNMLNYHYRTPSSGGHFTASPYSFKYPLKIDGDFGPQTQAAVKDYQKANHLQVDGIVGPKTWRSLGFTNCR